MDGSICKEENVNLDKNDRMGYNIKYFDDEENFYAEVTTSRGSLPTIALELTAFEHTLAEATIN